MGTRSDFYVGVGKNAEWLGSVAWDGYEWGEDENCQLMKATTESEYRMAVSGIAKARDDWTAPEQGWPWPWDDSNTTDCAYAFHGGKTEYITEDREWPDMSGRKNIALGKRSGIILIVG